MKHIVLIIDSLIGGGAEQTNLRLADMFIKNGFKVTVISLKNIIEIPYNKDMNLIVLDYKKDNFISYIRYLKYSQKLHTTLLKLGKVNLIIGSLGLSHKLMNIIDTKHNFYYALHGTTTRAKLDSKTGLSHYLKKKELIKIYNDKHIICVSNGVKNDILTLPIVPKSIQVIYNPFDIEGIRTKSNEVIDFKFPEEYIVHVGRFAKVKRHDILVKAFAQIENKNISLVLVGEGSEKGNIIQLVKELDLKNRIIFAGFFENPFPIIKNAKLLVLSSENEGFGNVLVESLILNTNIVSTRTLGAEEIMKNKLSNQISEINDSNGLARKINFSCNNDILLTEYHHPYKEKSIIKKYLYLM